MGGQDVLAPIVLEAAGHRRLRISSARIDAVPEKIPPGGGSHGAVHGNAHLALEGLRRRHRAGTEAYPVGPLTDQQFQTATNDAARFVKSKAGSVDVISAQGSKDQESTMIRIGRIRKRSSIRLNLPPGAVASCAEV